MRVALLAIVLLVGGDPGKPPVPTGNGRVNCPVGYPIVVYRGHYFPPNYPDPPSPTLHWTACFKTVADAADAGYERMPTPRGFLFAQGFYLYPALRFATQYCREAAKSTGFPVPCPGFTIDPPSSFVGCVTTLPCYEKGFFVGKTKTFGPAGYRGMDYEECTPPAAPGPATCETKHNGVHVLFLAGRGKGLVKAECCGGRAVGRTNVLGKRARWLHYSAGSRLNSGHVLLEWREGGVTYGVSLHGDNRTNRRLARLLAKHVHLVR